VSDRRVCTVLFGALVHFDPISRSYSKVKVVGQSSLSHEENVPFSTDACYEWTIFRLFVEFFALK